MKRLIQTALPIVALVALFVVVVSTAGGTASAQTAGGPDDDQRLPCTEPTPGPRPTEEPRGTVTPQSGTITSQQVQECVPEVQICHKLTNGNWELIWIPTSQLQAALSAGDKLPPCPANPTPSATPVRTPIATNTPAPTSTPGGGGVATPTATAAPTVTATATKTATAVASVTPLPPKTGNGGLVGDDSNAMRNGIILSIGLVIAIGAYGTYERRRRDNRA